MRLPKFIRRLWMPLFAVLILGLIATIQIREPFQMVQQEATKAAVVSSATKAAPPQMPPPAATNASSAPRYGPCVAPYSSYDGTTRCQTPNPIMPRTAACPTGANGVVGTRHSSGKCGIPRPRA
jgi:hypothetical protein